MLELIFAIVIIGILASIAIPKLAATRTDAVISKGKTQVAAIRNGITIQKGLRLLQGGSGFPKNLEKNKTDDKLFDADILQTPIVAGSGAGDWNRTGDNKYIYYVTKEDSVDFDYNKTTGSFNCDTAVKYCNDLTK